MDKSPTFTKVSAGRRKIIYSLFFFCLIVFLIFAKHSLAVEKTYNGRVIFFDVGQGDSTLIQTPFNQDILIDGGPDRSVIDKLDQYMGAFNRDIELAILTHNHDDHFNGFLEIVKNSEFKIEQMIYANEVCDNKLCDEFFRVMKEKNVHMIQVNNVSEISLSSYADYSIDILGPSKKCATDKNLNNTSILNVLNLSGRKFLFTGDAENEVWEEFCETYQNLDLKNIDILKVPHHGSKNGLEKCLIDLIQPTEAVISSGEDNVFGHPHVSILEMLDSAGVIIRRTDIEQDIIY
ncbi:MBL fold metallo-hydrolase [bacterium]|nr:MAG: MBL fold metallo-hydrolase [bacterium]